MTNRTKADRRTFLGTTAIAGAMAAKVASAQEDTAANAGVGGDFELKEAEIAELAAGLGNGKHTAVSLTRMYLDRIQSLDGQLGSVIEINPDAEQIAADLDRERSMGKVRGPLHGVPVMVKDNFDTRDKMKTTAGSLALLDAPPPPEDSFVVQRLRKAGAVLIGKTNLSEWANIRSTNSTSGWSGRGGQCSNPYALDRNPCGSSSGSGAAVSANFCSVAVGTETDGSVTCPSACCGIVGIKPTLGLISRTGVIPISHSQDTAGPMARTVRDAAVLLGALAGSDPQDIATAEADENRSNDYTQFLDAGGLNGAKIAVARNYFGFHDDCETVLEEALEAMRAAGATLVDTERLSKAEQAGSAETKVLEYDLKHDMAAYLARLGPDSPMKTLQDLIDFNNANRDTELKYFGQEFFEAAVERGEWTDNAYIEARAKCLRLTRDEGIDGILDDLELDCFVAPSAGLPCLTDLINGDHWSGISSSPAAVAGYPNITVPAGHVFGLPLGISFFGRKWQEPKLLRIAYAFEQATKHRRAPEFLPTAKLDGV
ncbi:MAG: amidase [Planctomycetota bacterium]